MEKGWLMAHWPPAQTVHTTYRQLQPNLTNDRLVPTVHLKSNSLSPLQLIQLRCSTIFFHNKTQLCETLEGDPCSGLWQFRTFSCQETIGFYLQQGQKGILPGRDLHFHPKSHLNIERKKKWKSALKICSINHQKSQESLISALKFSATIISCVCIYQSDCMAPSRYFLLIASCSYQEDIWKQGRIYFHNNCRKWKICNQPSVH